jgi:circadian clock protein KaiB
MPVKDNQPFSTAASTGESFNERLPDLKQQRYILRLYIAGLSPRSTLAVERVRGICDRHLAGRYELTVVDLYLCPEEAKKAQIVVAPTLIKQVPVPVRLFVGDMTDERRILLGLNIAC